MTKLTQITTLIAAFALLAAPAFSDTLVLKNGEKVSGYFEGGSPRVIKFRASDGVVKGYDLLSVQQIQIVVFDDSVTRAKFDHPRRVTESSKTTICCRFSRSNSVRRRPQIVVFDDS